MLANLQIPMDTANLSPPQTQHALYCMVANPPASWWRLQHFAAGSMCFNPRPQNHLPEWSED